MIITDSRSRILDNIMEHVGDTPLVRINRIGREEGLECEIGTETNKLTLVLTSPS